MGISEAIKSFKVPQNNSKSQELNVQENQDIFYNSTISQEKWTNPKTLSKKQFLSADSAQKIKKYSKKKCAFIAILLIVVLSIYKFCVHYFQFQPNTLIKAIIQQVNPTDVPPCPQKFIINYVWIGNKTKIPQKYAEYLSRCKDNVRLLDQNDLDHYVKLWNEQEKDHQIAPKHLNWHKITPKADMLRKLFLYFESGVYSDFDTEINENCFDRIITDEIVFTNSWGSSRGQQMAEQNFMLVLQKYNTYMRTWIISQIDEAQNSTRWNVCNIKPCFIINCQTHRYDGAWK